MFENRYQIIETAEAPLISESRSTVYDVLRAHNDGSGLYEICRIYNLTPLQVETALAYIDQHRERLEEELAEILVIRAERERYYRKVQEEHFAKIRQQPMTAERAKFYAWRDKQREILGITDE